MDLNSAAEMAFEVMWLNDLEEMDFRFNDLSESPAAMGNSRGEVLLGQCLFYEILVLNGDGEIMASSSELFPPQFIVIELDRKFVLANEPFVVRDVILHEVAHALVGFQHSHDDSWESVYRAIGGFGNAAITPLIVLP